MKFILIWLWDHDSATGTSANINSKLFVEIEMLEACQYAHRQKSIDEAILY